MKTADILQALSSIKKGVAGSAKATFVLVIVCALAFVALVTAFSLMRTVKTAGVIFEKAQKVYSEKLRARAVAQQEFRQTRRIIFGFPVPVREDGSIQQSREHAPQRAKKQPPPEFPVCNGARDISMSLIRTPSADVPLQEGCRSGWIEFLGGTGFKFNISNGATNPLEILFWNGDWARFDGKTWSSNFTLPDAGRYESGAAVQSGIRYIGDLAFHSTQHASFRLRGPGVARITIEPK